jgi:hypothetical protein
MFPSFLLKKVYVQQSLKNTETGFQFTLKNIVDSGTLGGIKSLTVDGVEIPLSAISIKTPNLEKKAEEISFRSTVPLRINMEAAIMIAGQPLSTGNHELKLAINVLEAGKLEIAIKDDIA